ncbi:MAG: dihydrofolate reductase family protein [Saprospiraceae bacterium]
MRKIKLYSAISLDGKIAKASGEVDWLDQIPNPNKLDYGYFAFYDTIDTVLMGNKTYQQVLGFDVPYPYREKKSYVFTRDTSLASDENVTFISKNIPDFLTDLKEQEGKDIWLVGGGALNALLLKHQLVDEFIVHVMPIVLGGGISLFSDIIEPTQLELLNSKTYDTGVVELNYQVKKQFNKVETRNSEP